MKHEHSLYTETLQELGEQGKLPEDVAFIGSYDGQYGCTWEEFAELADIQYSSGYGAQEIAEDLVILFKDGTWLERSEYDGSEWWSYRKPPVIPLTYAPIIKLKSPGAMWLSVKSLQSHNEDN